MDVGSTLDERLDRCDVVTLDVVLHVRTLDVRTWTWDVEHVGHVGGCWTRWTRWTRWTLLDVGCWMLDVLALAVDHWAFDVGRKTVDVGRWTRRGALDV